MDYKNFGINTRIALDDIAAERARQIDQLGFTPAVNALETDGELAVAAAWYALPTKGRENLTNELRGSDLYTAEVWPWDPATFKPGNRLRDLAKAGALIAAEYERLWSIRHDDIEDVRLFVDDKGFDNWEKWKAAFVAAADADGWVYPENIYQTDWEVVKRDSFIPGESALQAYRDYYYEQ